MHEILGMFFSFYLMAILTGILILGVFALRLAIKYMKEALKEKD